MPEDRVVVTGAGLVCSLGGSAQALWEGVSSGRTGVRSIEGFDASGFACRHAAQITPLRPDELGLHPRDSRIMDTPSLMLMKATRDAYREAALDQAAFRREEIGFFAGMGMVDYGSGDLFPAVLKSLNADGELDYGLFYTRGYTEIYPLWPLSMLNNIGFCQVATSLDIQGENTVFSPHADSGAMAVAEGVKTLLDGRAKVVLCGGVSEKVGPFSLARAQLAGVLNTSDPPGPPLCQPFDAARKGTILGEGCGVIALELESSARKRAVPYRAAITGYGFSCEPAERSSGPTPKALKAAMEQAIERGGGRPSEIDAVIAHGDGTVAGDRNEMEAIHDLFSGDVDRLPVFSSKGALGHLLAAAPLVDVLLGISMANYGLVPATPSTSPDPSVRFRLVYGKPLKRGLGKILINGQSYEGQAASLLLEAVGEV